MKKRAIVFIDGNNFYHALKEHIFSKLGRIHINYRTMSQRLALNRELLEIRYYIGRVRNEGDRTRYAHQRKFIDFMQKDGVRFFFGRLEKRTVPSTLSKELGRWMNSLKPRGITLDSAVYRKLHELRQKEEIVTWVEKAVERYDRYRHDLHGIR